MKKNKEDIKKILSNPEIGKIGSFVKNPTKSNAENIFGKESILDGVFSCKSCEKTNIPIKKIKIFNTPIVKGATAFLCDECWNHAMKEKAVLIVCSGCKEVIKISKPWVNPKTGFKAKPSFCYHINICPRCSPQTWLDNPDHMEPLIEEVLMNPSIKNRIDDANKKH